MSTKVLKVKEFIKSRNSNSTAENIEKELNEKFAMFLQAIANKYIKYQQDDSGGHFTVRLKPMISPGKTLPLYEIYGALLEICNDTGKNILLKRLQVTPRIYDPENFIPRRAIMAIIKYADN